MKYGDVEVVRKETCFEGFFRLEKYRLRHSLFGGGMSREMSRELHVRGHAVVVLPYDPRLDQVVFIEQFRIGAIDDPDGAWLTEVVAGMIGDGEQAEDVARREAEEEAGCALAELEFITKVYTTPGGCSETVQIYCGRTDASAAGGIHGLDHENEDIRVVCASFDEAMQWLVSGRINSAAPVIALQWLALNRERLRQCWV